MPIYNAGAYLRLAVLSVLAQSIQDWELLVIDDGSTDNAVQSLDDIRDPRVRILRDGANRGLAARLNEAIDLARGRYFARMDQDDVSYPERFAQQLRALDDDPALDLVATRAVTIDENNALRTLFPYALTHHDLCARPWRGFHLPHPTWMGRIEWFRKHRYAQPGPFFCEDQELLLRSYPDSRFATVDAILFAYRVRGGANPLKLARTRRTVRDLQVRQFRARGQWHLAALALLVYLARRTWDHGTRLLALDDRPGRAVVDQATADQWRAVLHRLAPKAEAR